MRQRDQRFADQAKHKAQGDALYDKRAGTKPIKFFRPEDFDFHDERTASCPAGQRLTGTGATYGQRGQRFRRYEADARDCAACALRGQCLRNPNAARGRQVARFERRRADAQHPSQRMRDAIDSPRGRALYSRRIATVEPVFANIRHHKRMSRFTLRGKAKVWTQWQLYCLVHNIEKIATRAMPQG
jgi:Transposase DDE domain